MQFSANETLAYAGNTKNSPSDILEINSLLDAIPLLRTSHADVLSQTGFSPTGFYCEAEKQFWQMLILEERPHRCEGWAEKEAFQQDNMLWALWAMTPSFFDKVHRDGRTLLPLEFGFFGPRVWGARVRFAFGCSRMLCCTSAASHGKDSCMSDVTDSNATSCPFYSTWYFIGTNLPQSKFMQQTPFNQWRICHCWCSAVTFIGNVST